MGGSSVSRFPDDWGRPLNQDPDRVEPPAPAKKKKTYNPDSRTGLVMYFHQNIPVSMNRVGANVNGPAMMKAFGKLEEKGFTASDIRGMIDAFVRTTTRRPLPVSVAPWRAFLADIDRYADEVRRAPTKEENHDVEIDPRLQ